MSVETLNLSPNLYQYLHTVTLREPQTLRELRAETQKMTGARMQISPEQGQLMALLVELIGAKKTLDIGTFTGYSALIVALALPGDGKVVSFDTSRESTDVAKRFWDAASVENKIELKLGPALEQLQALIDKGEAETFDFAFIDADKNNYDGYYEKSLALLRKGGLIAVDNVLWGGSVADPANQDKDTQSIRALNEKIHNDKRVTMCMVPIGDGLTLARKR